MHDIITQKNMPPVDQGYIDRPDPSKGFVEVQD
jgi:hypothetical protein